MGIRDRARIRGAGSGRGRGKHLLFSWHIIFDGFSFCTIYRFPFPFTTVERSARLSMLPRLWHLFLKSPPQTIGTAPPRVSLALPPPPAALSVTSIRREPGRGSRVPRGRVQARRKRPQWPRRWIWEFGLTSGRRWCGAGAVPTGDPAREIFFELFPALSQFYVPNLCHVLVFYFHF